MPTSEWGTANCTVPDADPPPTGASPWGTANFAVPDADPPPPPGVSGWGRVNFTMPDRALSPIVVWNATTSQWTRNATVMIWGGDLVGWTPES